MSDTSIPDELVRDPVIRQRARELGWCFVPGRERAIRSAEWRAMQDAAERQEAQQMFRQILRELNLGGMT